MRSCVLMLTADYSVMEFDTVFWRLAALMLLTTHSMEAAAVTNTVVRLRDAQIEKLARLGG